MLCTYISIHRAMYDMYQFERCRYVPSSNVDMYTFELYICICYLEGTRLQPWNSGDLYKKQLVESWHLTSLHFIRDEGRL